MEVKKITGKEFEVLANGNQPLLVDFYADWCGPCRMLAPVLEEIAAEHPELTVVKINVDNEHALAARFGIVSIPYVALIQNGQVVASALGYKPKADLLTALGI